MNMIKFVMILFLLAAMGCGQQEEVLSEERSKIIAMGDRGNTSGGEEDADVDPSEIFEVSYYYDYVGNSRYGIYIGNNKIVEELAILTMDQIPVVKVDINKVATNRDKYNIYNIEHSRVYTFSNDVDGNSLEYNPINPTAPGITRGRWIATISLVEEGGDKNKPLQIYDIYK